MTTVSYELSKEARSRFFPNFMADWPVMAPPGPAFPTPAELHHLRKKTDKLIEIIQDDWPANLETQNDATVYQGAAGAALMFLRLWEADYELPDQTNALERAEEYIRIAHRLIEEKEKLDPVSAKTSVSFTLGDAGTFALAAVIYHHLGRREKAAEYVDRLTGLQNPVVPLPGASRPGETWEPFYGMAGYLYCIYFVEQHLEREIAPKLTDRLIQACLESGLARAQIEAEAAGSRPPLMYTWHGEKYLGIAHGIAGVVNVLLLRPQELDTAAAEGHVSPGYRKVLEDTVDWLISLRIRDSGNYPAQLDDPDDTLVHWCHGAPGMGMLFCRAYEVFKHRRYLDAALAAGDVVWQRGLLKKGLGLCHGIAGNGYLFLELFKVTHDPKHLWRAWKFAEFAVGPEGEKLWNVPSQPYSLFLGLAGTVCFIADLCCIGDATDKETIDRIVSFPGCGL